MYNGRNWSPPNTVEKIHITIKCGVTQSYRYIPTAYYIDKIVFILCFILYVYHSLSMLSSVNRHLDFFPFSHLV